jgi:HEAT repeat protein
MRTRLAALALLLGLAPGAAWAGRWPDDVPQVQRALRSAERSVREDAIETLRGDRAPEAVSLLIDATQDSSDDLARRAMFYLAELVPYLNDAAPSLDAIVQAASSPRKDLRATSALLLGELGRVFSSKENALFASCRDVALRLLEDVDSDVRRAAVRSVGALDGAASVWRIEARLFDVDPETKRVAAEMLGQYGGEDSIIPLGWVLQDPTPAVRVAVVRSLGQIGGPRVLPPLLGALFDLSPEVRAETAAVFGKLGDPRAVDGLLMLLDDTESVVIEQVVQSLGFLGDARAAAPMMKLLSSSLVIEETLGVALGRLGKASADLLGERLLRVQGNSNQSALVLRLLRHNPDPRATEILLSLAPTIETRGSSFRSAWIQALEGRRDPRVVATLLVLARHPDLSLRLEAFYSLPSPPPREAVFWLIELIQQPGFRGRALSLLLEVSPDELQSNAAVLESLCKELLASNEGSPNEQEDLGNLLALLSRIAPERAALLLVAQLRSEYPALRREAAGLLWSVEVPGLSARLLRVAQDAKEPGRAQALRALYHRMIVRPEPDIIASVAPLLADGESFVSYEAMRILALAPGAKYTQGLLRSFASSDPWKVRLLAATLADHQPREALLPLLQALRSPDNLARIAAAWSLGKTGSREAIAPLLEALELGVLRPERAERTEGLVALNAAWALGNLGAEEAVPLLTRCLSTPYLKMRANCAGALGRLGAVEVLRGHFVREEKEAVLRSALYGLARRPDDAKARAFLEQEAAGPLGDLARRLSQAPLVAPTLGLFAPSYNGKKEPVRGGIYLIRTPFGENKAGFTDPLGDIIEPGLPIESEGLEWLSTSPDALDRVGGLND